MTRILTVMALVALANPAPAEEPKTAREGLKELVAGVAESVRKAIGDRTIRVGDFTPTGNDHSNAGGAFAAAIASELGAKVQRDAGLELEGRYILVDDPKKGNAGLKTIRVDVVIVELGQGGLFKEFPQFTGYIRAAADLAAILVVPVAFKPDDGYKTDPGAGRNKDVQRSIPPARGKPPAATAHVEDGTLVRSSAQGKYAVEIQAGSSVDGVFEKLPVRLNDTQFPGLAFVDISADQYYRVRVVNNDSVEVAVFLQLDGIDQFTFSEDRTPEGRPRFGSWIVESGRHNEIVIKGWHKCVGDKTTPGQVFGFLTTQAGKGAASKFKTQSQGKVGTICVSIAHTKLPSNPKGEGLETTVGATTDVRQEVVVRKVEVPHEVIPVRYSR